MTTESSMPRLAPPGAGLPRIERFFANLMIHAKARRTSTAQVAATFEQELEEILGLVKSRPSDVLGQRVLIRRLPGLEDSSRYWSALMTLDHLRIVNHQVGGVIASLCEGRVPPEKVGTADVKPSENVGWSVMADFERTSREFADVVKIQKSLKSPVSYPHPWFGPLDAAGWHFMVAFHMGLHRKQILRIFEGM